MAKIEFIKEQIEDQRPASIECIEVRPWGLGGARHQDFAIGSGANFDATSVVLLEIIYSIGGVQFFYTRNYLHFTDNIETNPYWQNWVEEFTAGRQDNFGFGDMLPETRINLKREKFTYRDSNDQEVTSVNCTLEISADVGAVIGQESPGMRMINIQLPYLRLEPCLQFMQTLTREITDAYQGKRPNPAELPDGASDWPFVRELNRKAYDLISEKYEEDYFSNPLLTGMFDTWLDELSTGANILDAGCGHGDPVISRLLEKGCQVTGTDLSPRMLARAREGFPGVTFINQMVSDIRSDAEYDGACSFSSLLYLDPIDLSHSIYRLYQALKPGSLLFLYAKDLHPSWRGLPYKVDINQWMWTWSYGIADATHALEEFEYFKVLKAQDISTEERKQERIDDWRKNTQEEYDKLFKSLPEGASFSPPDLSQVPTDLSYDYVIVARRGA